MEIPKKAHVAKKRLTKVVKRLFLANSGLTPKTLLEANIQVASGTKRFLQGFSGIILLIASIILFFNINKDSAITLALIPLIFILLPIGCLLIRNSLRGEKKKVKEFLQDMVSNTDMVGNAITNIDSIDVSQLVNNVFKESSAKFKEGGGEFGGGGSSGSWDMNNNINVNLPDVSSSLENLEIPI